MLIIKLVKTRFFFFLHVQPGNMLLFWRLKPSARKLVSAFERGRYRSVRLSQKNTHAPPSCTGNAPDTWRHVVIDKSWERLVHTHTHALPRTHTHTHWHHHVTSSEQLSKQGASLVFRLTVYETNQDTNNQIELNSKISCIILFAPT